MLDVEWEACLLEPRRDAEVERRVRRRYGRVSPALAYFSECPQLSEALAGLNAQLTTAVRIDHDLADLVSVVVSHDNACRYCYAATRALLRVLGFSDERIRALERDMLTADFGPAERAAFEFARRLSRANPLPGAADAARLRTVGFDDLAIAEIAGCAALSVFHNRLATMAALPPEHYESLPERWYVRLFAPIAAVVARRVRTRAPVTPLRPEQRTGPFAPVVCALDGLPLAGELRAFLDALWASPGLPPRSKALVFGVVARGLGCAASEGEAARLAVAAGMAPDAVGDALQHLASPALDPVEALALPFVRETVWYQPAALQRRSRELRDALPREPYIELLMTAAAANMVCRLCPALVAPS